MTTSTRRAPLFSFDRRSLKLHVICFSYFSETSNRHTVGGPVYIMQTYVILHQIHMLQQQKISKETAACYATVHNKQQ